MPKAAASGHQGKANLKTAFAQTQVQGESFPVINSNKAD